MPISLLKSILYMFLRQLYEMEVLNGASEFGMYASLVEVGCGLVLIWEWAQLRLAMVWFGVDMGMGPVEVGHGLVLIWEWGQLVGYGLVLVWEWG